MDLKYSAPMFYVPELSEFLEDPKAERVLDPKESRHAGGSRRLRSGDEIVVFDGKGQVARCELVQIDPRGGSPRFVGLQSETRPYPARRLGLACAVPKGDRQNTLLDMATQIGMTDYWPGVFRRSAVRPGELNERWTRIAIEACKQSRRPHLPQINEPADIDTVLTLSRQWSIVVADADGEALNLCAPRAGEDDSATLIVVGPEGGFDADEMDKFDHAGVRKFRLAESILRTETAAVASLAILSTAGR